MLQRIQVQFPSFRFFGGFFVRIFKLSIFLHSIRSICHISGPNRPFSLNKSYMANVNLQRIQVQFSSFLFFNFFYVRIFKLSLLLYSVRSICHIPGPRYAPLSLSWNTDLTSGHETQISPNIAIARNRTFVMWT